MRSVLQSFVVLATAGVLFWPAEAAAIPSFTRATGLTCNQCHTTWAPVPDFTFTGRKFRLNGYRAPFIADKIEAGEEGALNGRRLALGLQNAFSLRYRSDIFSQSKAASDPAGPAPDASPIRSDPGGTISWFYAGPIGEHFGVWNEFYLAEGGAERGNRFRVTTFDEYDVKFVLTPGNNLVGLAYTTQALNCLAGFCPFSSYVPNHMQRGGFNTAGTSYANLAIYGLFNDRVLGVFGIQPGEDNLDYERLNYQGILAYWFDNSDYRQIVANVQFKAGNDAIPIVTSPFLADGSREWDYRFNVRGLSDITGSTTPYLAADLGDFIRTKAELYYHFVDRGPHSLNTAVGYSYSQETYDNGAETMHSAVGGVVRYMYNRTWGIDQRFSKNLTYEYTDVGGGVYDIPDNIGFRTYLQYRPAMNAALFVSFGNSQASVIGEDWRNGWSWNLQFDFMF